MRLPLTRRTLLRGTGAALALPYLEAMTSLAAGTEKVGETGPRRMLAICNNLGFVPDRFFPQASGRHYELSPYLSELAGLRNDFTVFDGVSHPGVDGSHASDVSFLTAAPHPGSGGFQNSISLDQFIASQIGNQTRFPSMTLGVNAQPGRRSLSFTESGVLIPCEDKASEVYRRLFLRGTETEVNEQMRRLKLGQSIMDAVGEQSNSLKRRLGASDRGRLDQYETAVRDVEKRLAENEEWSHRPKPKAPVPQPVDPADRSNFMEKSVLMYQMIKLAFETDSTRSITLLLDSNYTPTLEIPGVDITDGYHNLSHHGRNESKLAQLEAIDRRHLQHFADFMRSLKNSPDGDTHLLANTAIIYGSNLGDANKHTTTNMPMILAGGRFRHGQALAFDRKNNYPLPNLFVSVLQQMGFEVDRFASSTGTMRGLELL